MAKLKKWISKEIDDLIFVWYHAENEAPWELPDLHLNKLCFHYSAEYVSHTHIQDWFENANDKGKKLIKLTSF
jgi:hypothetical protein